MAPSSNWGPTNELFGLPSYIAPGQNILSTVPMEMGGVEIQRGSSWAGPLAGERCATIHLILAEAHVAHCSWRNCASAVRPCWSDSVAARCPQPLHDDCYICTNHRERLNAHVASPSRWR